jgi:hypothetical protein
MSNPDNKLGEETSPYLLQHADNPVNWQAWNAQALQQAQQQNRPILLSIGYSACHWCHVMAHESFEDQDTAELMNEHFVNIKVDREERPDLDKIYQTAHSILTGRAGGWPLTVFLTPQDQMPFFAGTYFPRERRHGMMSFREILNTVNEVFHSRQQDIDEQNRSLKAMLETISEHDKNSASPLNALPLDLARRQIIAEFDHLQGGFSKAPKFPHPAMIERCLRHWALGRRQQQDDQEILDAALFTLSKMAMGGIFDHLAGGFCRYSTDEKWMIPHFEKMLYDNGQLLALYCYAWQITGDPLYKKTALQTADWVINEMQSPEGGYYSALDADSEGEEGKYYVWTRSQVKQLLDDQEYPVFAHCYGLDGDANFEGNWHLHAYVSNKQLAEKFGSDESRIEQLLESSRTKLLAERATRTAPGRDDKILTSWNALMINSLCIAGRIFGRTEYIDSARRALDFIHSRLWHEQHFLATYKDGKSHLNAYLDDYAYMLNALLQYLQCNWDNHMLAWARDIADSLLQQFEDHDRGGFYFTGHDHETLIQRSKTFADDAMPSGNGMAAYGLQKLGLLLGDSRYLGSAEDCLKAAANDMQQHAIVTCSMLHALEEFLNSSSIIIVRGNREDMQNWQQPCIENYLPELLCFAIDASIEPLPPINDKQPRDSSCAYICEGMQCRPPITDFNELKAYIESHGPGQVTEHG